MSQISARLPDELIAALDEAAAKSHRTRADVIRQAVEYYLDDLEDISHTVEGMHDSVDPSANWKIVKNDFSICVKQNQLNEEPCLKE